jgi:hypothetical protein
MTLRGIVGRPLQLDPDAGIELHESLQLLGDERSFSAERGAGESEDCLMFRRSAIAPETARRTDNCCQSQSGEGRLSRNEYADPIGHPES